MIARTFSCEIQTLDIMLSRLEEWRFYPVLFEFYDNSTVRLLALRTHAN
jgi:hypothetical protein